MITFDPPQTPAWQLPWLRVSLILRQMVTTGTGRNEDLAALLTMREELAQRGWFN